MRKLCFIGSVFLCFAAVSCGKKQQEQEVAVLHTTMGDITIALYNDTPRHTENFVKLAREGFYNGTTFHRVIPDVLIQGGDPNTKDADRSNDGQGGPGYTLPAEIHHQHIAGAVAAARLPDRANPQRRSNGSQFYICVTPQSQFDGKYTVFGYVIHGMDVVRNISHVQRDKQDNPLQRVTIERVTVELRKMKYNP